MQKAKICIITSVHPAFDNRIFYKQAMALAKAGYNVTLIAQHERDEVVDGIRIISLPKPKNRLWRMIGTLKILPLALKQKAVVYHFHDPELLPIGVLLKLFTRANVIYDVHEDVAKDIMSKNWIPKFFRKWASSVYQIIQKISLLCIDKIIIAEDSYAKNYKNKKVVAVRNFPILSNFIEIKKNKSNDTGVFTLIYIGGLTEIRGVTQMVQTLGHINSNREVKLILCGNFYPASYEEQVRSLKGFEKVEYVGWINPNEISVMLVKADVGLVVLHPIPNYIESLPTKLFEYMAAGLPVIASNFPLWKEIVESNKCGICLNPLDPKEIADAIEYLMEHPEEARKMGENGRRAVIEKYNWENESKKLLELYERIQ